MADSLLHHFTLEAADALHEELGRLLWKVENLMGENAAGTYPTEVEMTLRLAWLTAGRAASQMREAACATVGPSEAPTTEELFTSG